MLINSEGNQSRYKEKVKGVYQDALPYKNTVNAVLKSIGILQANRLPINVIIDAVMLR